MKFKNIKKKAKNKESPSNSRTIPVKSKHFKLSFPRLNHITLLKIYRGALKVFVVIIFIVTATIVTYDFAQNLQIKQNIDLQRETLARDLNFWENFISQHQNYRDAYFQASILEYKLGNTSRAKIYVEKGLVLDPNSEDGKKLEKFLANK